MNLQAMEGGADERTEAQQLDASSRVDTVLHALKICLIVKLVSM